ncbi:hypothetical protein [Xylocopilactobacillus apis]|uniref:Colicin immunity protein / pyocin immunity protein n=1 Tax=Xylocopilactobacillus apis TaxID=2932183 RepID=A0AAU9D663_9LACO|nr:hypothetical protein [Xylocopilactobacillus apis]BDR56905.1 hypothetical protein KIMC2_14670 [Xylocopilactobacillus apis]
MTIEKQLLSMDNSKAQDQIDTLFNFILENDPNSEICDPLQHEIVEKYPRYPDLPNSALNEVGEELVSLIRERIHLW